MKRAIIVKGQSNSGKSTIIKWIYRWLKLYYKPIETGFWHNGDNKLKWLSGDVGCLLQIGRLSIFINSAGDEGPEVQDFLTTGILNNYDIIIGACRSKGITNNVVNTILIPYSLSKPLATSFISTYHHHNPKMFNKQCVKELRAYLIGLK